ncbi:SLC24A2 (predicted) [Pycnogonum litorale]
MTMPSYRRNAHYRRRWRDPIKLVGVALLIVISVVLWKSWRDDDIRADFQNTEYATRDATSRRILSSSSSCDGNSSDDGSCKKKARQFPPDIFSEAQRKNGAIIVHVFGMVYMFVALAIICDEFFVPALDVIIYKLAISEDVAGATFMAAGGSAPELFTSIIGVFISYDDVGIGTIVGSAVFNILFVIGMCALFSKTALYLTWWPLFRDVTFYSIALIILIIFFKDSTIVLYEAVILLSVYIMYVTFMKFNSRIERAVKKVLYKNKVTRVRSTDQLVPNYSRRASTPILHSGSKFRHGLLQLMIHTIDPLHDGKVDEKACQLHAIASLKVLLDATKTSNGTIPANAQKANLEMEGRENNMIQQSVDNVSCTTPPGATIENDSLNSSSGRFSQETRTTTLEPIPEVGSSVTVLNSTANLQTPLEEIELNKNQRDSVIDAKMEAKPTPKVSINVADETISTVTPCNTSTGTESQPSVTKVEEVDEPLDMSWPTGFRKQVYYVVLAPITFPLWLTLPDTRRQEKRRWFPVTFLGSIIWIALFSYLMVWWATIVGETIGIPTEVMGLTFLAAGTSIPDLITSVIVARKGFGDMAVSSSVGSNLFDVTVGLPFPWILYNLIYGKSVKVGSKGLACSVIILFIMLMFVIISIAAFKWKMNKGLGISMFILYFVFVAISLVFEFTDNLCNLNMI